MILYAAVSVDPDTSTQLTQYIIPANIYMQVPSITLWANADAEYSIYKNGNKVGGGCTSAATPTLQLAFYDQISMKPFDVFQIYATQFEDSTQTLHYTALLDQL